MIKLLDGAIGSELIKKGEVLPNYIWSADSNIKNPELVYQIHQDYIQAGSEYITTNTFRTTPRAYKKTGLSDSDSIDMAHKSLKIAVKMTKKAASDKAQVLGSIAPLEDCYKPELFQGENIAKQEFKQLGKWLKGFIYLCEKYYYIINYTLKNYNIEKIYSLDHSSYDFVVDDTLSGTLALRNSEWFFCFSSF